MAALELTCEVCERSHPFSVREVQDLVTAFQQRGGDRLRCPTCGMSLAQPLQRALQLVPAATPLPTEMPLRRRHVRVPLDLPVTYQRPGGAEASGRVKNLSVGGLLLEAPELLRPGTHLRLQLPTRRGMRTFEGEVRWIDATRHSGSPIVAHGVRFTSPGGRGLAVDLRIGESQNPPGGE